jgi:hypothetical protein
MSENLVHGSIIASRFAFIEERWGVGAKRSTQETLPLCERRLIESPTFQYRWYRYSILEMIDLYILINLAENDLYVLKELGRYSADYNFRCLPSQLISLPPDEILKNASRIKTLFQNFGECRLETIKKRGNISEARIIYRYPEEISENYCISALGYLERLFQLIGYRVVSIDETDCQARGGPAHCYRISWEDLQIDANRIKRTEKRSSIVTPQKSRDTLNKKSPAKTQLKKIESNTPRLSRLARTLILSIAVTAFIWTIQLLFSISAKPEEVSDKIYSFGCGGSLSSELKVDSSLLLLKPGQTWTDVRITVEKRGEEYSYTARTLASDTFFEISLGEFFDSKRRPLEFELPMNFSIKATVDGERRSCSCRLDQ